MKNKNDITSQVTPARTSFLLGDHEFTFIWHQQKIPIHKVTVTYFWCQPAFAAILWVKLSRKVCHCDFAEIRFVGKLVITETFQINQSVEFYSNITINLRPLNCTHYTTKWRSYRGRRFCDASSTYVFPFQGDLQKNFGGADDAPS